MYLGLLIDALPWWIGAPLLQLTILVVGMALDETYVNRATVLTGALALYVHAVVAGDVGLMVGVYLDVGLVIGAYGLYAYVVDAYVSNWFRVAAYFVYSPLAIFLVILIPDVVFPISLAIAGYANLQLMAYFAPTDPYYFGPSAPYDVDDAEVEPSASGEDDAVDASENADADDTAPDIDGTQHVETGDVAHPGAEPATASGESTERGILPEFMRRL